MPVRKIKGGAKPAKRTRPSSTIADEQDEDDTTGLSLPRKPIQVSRDFGSYSFCLYGEKGIGKTSLIGQFKNHLIFQFDPRRVNVSVVQIPAKGESPLDWITIRRYVKLLENRQESHRIHVCFDIIYRAYNLALQYISSKNSNGRTSHPSGIQDFGCTWNDIDNELQSVFNRIQDANCQLIVTAHSQYKERALRLGTKYELLHPQTTDRLWGLLRAFDFVFYYGYTGRQRTLTVRGDDETWAACGVDDTYLDPDGEPVRTLLIPDNAKEAHKILLEAFDNKHYGIEEETQDEETDEEE